MNNDTIQLLDSHRSFGGYTNRYRHWSHVLDCMMNFAVYLPPKYAHIKDLPTLYWLSGLGCTEENFIFKSGLNGTYRNSAYRLLLSIPALVVLTSQTMSNKNILDQALAFTSTQHRPRGLGIIECTTTLLMKFRIW